MVARLLCISGLDDGSTSKWVKKQRKRNERAFKLFLLGPKSAKLFQTRLLQSRLCCIPQKQLHITRHAQSERQVSAGPEQCIPWV